MNACSPPEQENEFKIINDLNKGSYFGEVALLTSLRRTCSVFTVSNCFFSVIKKEKFIKYVNNNPEIMINLRRRINSYSDDLLNNLIIMVKNVPSFRNLSISSIKKIVQCLRPLKIKSKQKVLNIGELSNDIFFIQNGKVSVVVPNLEKPNEEDLPLTTLKSGCCFNVVSAILERPAIFDYYSG